MNTLTKLALGMIGQLQPALPVLASAPTLSLPRPRRSKGLPLMQALQARQSTREFDPAPLKRAVLGDLLWATAGINRSAVGGRTAPSAMNAQEVLVYAALAQGLYLYDPQAHVLKRTVASDVRRVSGYQDFVDTAPLDLIFVAEHRRMKLVPPAQRTAFAFAAAGAMAQNAYLYCASAGLGCVIRAWFDAHALSQAMRLGADMQLLLAQTVGEPAAARRA
jgi:nitroreductase